MIKASDIEDIDRFLKDKAVSLWANWDTTDDGERHEGAVWLAKTIDELLNFIDKEEKS